MASPVSILSSIYDPAFSPTKLRQIRLRSSVPKRTKRLMFVTSMLRRRSRRNRVHQVPILRLPVLSSASSRILSSLTSLNPDDHRSLQVGTTRDLAEFAVNTGFTDLP